jgi:hypothetical protein
VGDFYQDTVHDLLGLFPSDAAEDNEVNNELMGAGALVAFQTMVLESLGSISV